MKPGDRVRCAMCSRVSAPLHDRGGEPFPKGALVADWEGPTPMHTTVSEGQAVICGWCHSLGDATRALAAQAKEASSSASLVLYREKAEAFKVAHGVYPPGRDNPDAVNDRELWAKWLAFIKPKEEVSPNAAAAGKGQPSTIPEKRRGTTAAPASGQLGLLF